MRRSVVSETMLETISDLELAYTAGVIDGEGCITVSMSRSFRVRLQVTNTNTGLIDWLAERFGGHVKTRKRMGKPNWKTSYDWTVSTVAARDILVQVMPYLVIKRRQAEIAIEMASLGVTALQGRRKGVPLVNQQRRKEIVQEMHDLNRKGIIEIAREQ